MSMTRLAWRGVLARPLRSLLSSLGVALGTAVLLAGLATNAGIEAAVAGAVRDQVGSTDLRVSAFGEVDLSPATVQVIAETPGVSIVARALQRRTYLSAAPDTGADTGADTTAGLPASVTVLGIDPAWEPLLHDLRLAEGSPLIHPDERNALVSERLAAEDSLAVGATIAMQGSGDRVTLRVVGILAGDGPFRGALGRTVVVPIEVAQAAFGGAGVSRIDIGLDAGVDPRAVAAALEERLVLQPYALSTPEDIAADSAARPLHFRRPRP